jgi:DNA polymerase-1
MLSAESDSRQRPPGGAIPDDRPPALASRPVTNDAGDPPKRLFLLDGHSLSYRAFFALPTSLATSSGQVTNAVYGFTSMLIKLLAEERPDLIAVAFDVGAPTVRLEKYAEYKAGRPEAPDEFRQQLGLIVEVLETLQVPVIGVPGHEADDAIATLALQAVDRGLETVIVTADRDFFQLVRDGITVMFNVKGISDIKRYDEAAVTGRFGLPPSRYLDYVALKGDPSDNIPGVPGVGEKTASRLVQEFGSIEELVRRTDELKGKLRGSIEEAGEQLALNKELARLHTEVELDIGPEDCVMGGWDMETIRHLFTTLEFRTLFERLEEVSRTAKPAAEAQELDLREAGADEVAALLAGEAPKALRFELDGGAVRGVATSSGGGQAAYAAVRSLDDVAPAVEDPSSGKWTHDAKDLETVAIRAGHRLAGVRFDTMLAAYLLDPAAPSYEIPALSERYLGADVLGQIGEEDEGQLFGASWRLCAAEAAAVALLSPVMAERLERADLNSLLSDVELPLSSVLARMQARGIALDAEYLDGMAEGVRDEMAALRASIYEHAGEEFNLNSPPQLRTILYDKLKLSPGKRTPKGQLSTDASVLEKLRSQHPIVDALLSWRELDKLNSTYLEALPRQVDPTDGRVHTTFNQTGAATGRLSSSNPNLQNIPARSELGRQIRRAFVPGSAGQVLLVADYSQIELRILAHLAEDEGLRAAFGSGEDIHAATAAKVYGLPLEQVDSSIRSRAKAVNYGLAYGMNAYGLATRLEITPDEAQEFIDAYFASFPQIGDYLDRQVAKATADGFTETLLGRRRYIPELQASNPRVRDMGRRMALNAPIQGSAADVFKLGMLRVDAALGVSRLDCHMLLTVHDELVFEVAEEQVEEAAGLVRSEMEGAYALSVPLQADIGWGSNWADAAPEGH